MTTPTEDATMRYNALKPLAVAAAHDYIMTRTPAPLQDIMSGLIDADLNPPPDPTVATIHNGGTVVIRQTDGSNANGTAAVASGTLTSVTQPTTPTKAMIANGANIVVHNAADANQAGSPGVATVAGGALTKVNLTV